MINLLPSRLRSDVSYARRNTHLLRWCVGLLIGFISICLIIMFGLVYIRHTTTKTQQQISAAQVQLKDQKLEETQKRIESIGSGLKLTIQVLSREILFSSLLKQIGAAMPPGSALTGLSINKLQGGLDLNAKAKDYQSATQVQVNLQDPANKIFSKADIISISCAAGSNDNNYPCTVTIRALFSKDNTFLFTKNGGVR